jgi:hypothetical protein
MAHVAASRAKPSLAACRRDFISKPSIADGEEVQLQPDILPMHIHVWNQQRTPRILQDGRSAASHVTAVRKAIMALSKYTASSVTPLAVLSLG